MYIYTSVELSGDFGFDTLGSVFKLSWPPVRMKGGSRSYWIFRPLCNGIT